MNLRIDVRRVFALVASLVPATSLAVEAADGFTPPEMTVPDGFVVEVVAAPPLVSYPMMGCLDDLGRMFIAGTHGQNLDKAGLLKAKHRFIRMLEDTDGDGKFDRSTIFADGLVMPEGALWHRGSLYVLSSPYLWRFEDTDDDGVADVREKLVGEMEFNGKANQHGAYLGPCGRLYFSGGTFGYDLVGSDGKAAYPVGRANAAGVFSCRLDGSDVEIFGTGGINPVEVAFSPEGELFTTCPIIDNIGGRHDALIHWVRGATVGPQDFRPPPLPQTSYRLPPLSRWGQVAPSGLMMYRGTAFGDAWRGRLFATHFNTRTVVATRIERRGSTYHSFDEEFLTSPNANFHPTDIMEDADGSLLMIDTGGWFRISCPFSKTAKPEVPGAVYRIRRKDAKRVNDPRGVALDWKRPTSDELFKRLSDQRPAVRDKAINAWVDRGDKGAEELSALLMRDDLVGELESDFASAQGRRNAVWAAARIGTESARGAILAGLHDSDGSVRQAAARSAGILRFRGSRRTLQSILLDQKAQWSLRRAAATALGQLGDVRAVPALLQASGAGGDEFFNHAVVYALIEIGDFDSTSRGLTSSNPQIQHDALVALKRIDASRITQGHVAPLLQTDDARLLQTVQNLITQRPGWTDQIIDLVGEFAREPKLDAAQAATLRGAIVNYAKDERVQQVVARALRAKETAPAVRSVLLEGISRLPRLPESWLPPIGKLLESGNPLQVRIEILSVLSASGTAQLDETLRSLAAREKSSDLRAAAWSCLCSRGAAIPDDAVRLLCQGVTCYPILGPLERLESARALAKADLTDRQLQTVAKCVSTTGPIELPTLLGAFDSPPGDAAVHSLETAHVLLESLDDSPGFDSLSRAQFDQLVSVLPESARSGSRALFEKLKAGDQKQTERLSAIAAELDEGDTARGRTVFYSNQSACSACHRIEGQGGTIGPDLSRIGAIRKRRDLLESIVFPSATIVNNYETWSAILFTGRATSGVIQHATARSVTLRNTQRMQIVLNREDIEELVRQHTSIMPQGLDRVLSRQDLSDLLAFLQSLRGSQKTTK